LAHFFVRLPKPDLLRVATRIKGSDTWGISGDDWDWLNSRDVLVRKPRGSSGGSESISRADRQTGRLTRFANLRAHAADPRTEYPFRFISPDGRWVLRSPNGRNGRGAEALRIDGGKRILWPSVSVADDLVWSPD